MSRAPGPFTPNQVNWGSRPTRALNRHFPINKILPGKTFDFRVLSHKPYEVPVHYDGERNLPCTAKMGPCWFPHDKGKTTVQTWFQAWNRQVKRVELIVLTPGAWAMVSTAAEGVEDLRGARLELWRMGKNTRAAMGATLTINPDLSDIHLPATVDLKEQLCGMWNSPLRDPSAQHAREMRFASEVLPADQSDGTSPFIDDEIPH